MYTIEQLLLRRLEGWDADDWLFLTIGKPLRFLSAYPQIQRSDKYHGASELSIVIVCNKQTISDAWKEVDKLIEYKVYCLAIWVLGQESVKELVMSGRKWPHPINMCLSNDWQSAVEQFARAS